MNETKCKWCDSEECDCEDRIRCTKVGQSGHHQCGWCFTHNKPTFLCGPSCMLFDISEKKI